MFADEEARIKVMKQLKQIGAVVTQVDDYYVTADPSGNEIHLVI